MAKGRGSSGFGALVFLVLAVGTLYVAAVFVSQYWPIVLLLLLLVEVAIVFRNRRLVTAAGTTGHPSDFWLSDSQKAEFMRANRELDSVLAEIRETGAAGDREGVLRNADGQFSIRGRRGKELRAILETLHTTAAALEAQIRELSRLPAEKWSAALGGYIIPGRFLFATLVWVISVVAFHFVRASYDLQQALSGLSELGRTGMFGQPDGKGASAQSAIRWSILLGFATSFAALFLWRFISPWRVEKICARPPDVTRENVSSF